MVNLIDKQHLDFSLFSILSISYSTIRYSDPTQSTFKTSQSGEASSSNQSQKEQGQPSPVQNTSDSSAPLPLNLQGAVGSETSTKDLENSLQKAHENFIRSQIEVTKILSCQSILLKSFYINLYMI